MHKKIKKAERKIKAASQELKRLEKADVKQDKKMENMKKGKC